MVKKTKMKKNVALVVAGTLLAVACLVSSAFAVMKIPTLEVTGQLEKVDESTQPAVIFINVNGTTASGPLSERCSFSDVRGNSMERAAFVKNYTKKMVTLELIEDSGEVIDCRAK
ncbi:MAG: hypothetical protein LBQ42_07035 [Synergistaceae bacterium]|jgi:hypothetical protein|nr:hypothetical protein [Synergistaceae bacterium]